MIGKLISIGNELINGQIIDLNSHYAAASFWAAGLSIKSIVTVGDDIKDIQRSLALALADCTFLVVSGGLGFGENDFTVLAVAKYFGLPLDERIVITESLEMYNRYLQFNPVISRVNIFPRGSKLLNSIYCGFQINSLSGQPIFFLPDIPKEYRRLINLEVIPRLLKRFNLCLPLSSSIYIYGLIESEVRYRLKRLINKCRGLRISYYTDSFRVIILFTINFKNLLLARVMLQQLEEKILNKFQDVIVNKNKKSIEEMIGKYLTYYRLTLAIAESCTGGLISHRITQVSGSMEYLERSLVVYSNYAKRDFLGVSNSTISVYSEVSAQCAVEMAIGIRKYAEVDLGLSVTGIIGPTGGDNFRPIGTIWFALATPNEIVSEGRCFYSDRNINKLQASEYALIFLYKFLVKYALLYKS